MYWFEAKREHRCCFWIPMARIDKEINFLRKFNSQPNRGKYTKKPQSKSRSKRLHAAKKISHMSLSHPGKRIRRFLKTREEENCLSGNNPYCCSHLVNAFHQRNACDRLNTYCFQGEAKIRRRISESKLIPSSIDWRLTAVSLPGEVVLRGTTMIGEAVPFPDAVLSPGTMISALI